MLFRRYFPGFWGGVLDIILILVVVLAIFHNPVGSAAWVQERIHNGSDILSRITIFVQHL
jgi:hypothetical protein